MGFAKEDDRLTEEIEWFLDHLSVERGASPHTVSAYQGDLMQVSELLRKWKIDSFAKYDDGINARIRGVFAKHRLSATTVSRKLSSIRSLLKFLMKHDCGPAELFASTPRRRRISLPKALSLEEIEAILEAASAKEKTGLRDRAMLELLYGAGLRVSELTNLDREDYIAGEALLRVEGKRGKVRVMPLPILTKEWLDRYLEEGRARLARARSGSAVFLNAHGGRMSRSGVFCILRECAKRAGVKTAISPHTLRHTYAVHLVQAGADLRSVQELLGHESVATTDIYTQLDTAALRKKYDKAHPRAKTP